MIDANPERNRAEPWLSFQLNTKGELYWDVAWTYAYATQDPWHNQYYQTGNGDGTLFYPGVPTTAGRSWPVAQPPPINGNHDIPIASIRLKMIREAMEDYEYLLLDSAKLGNAHAQSLASGVFPYASSTDRSGLNTLLTNTRLQMGNEIDGGAPTFTLSANPASVSTALGATTTSTITVSPQNGFTGAVNLTVTGAPSGATATLSPTSVTTSGTSTLTLNSGTAAAGNYTVTVTGTSGSITKTIQVAWAVTAVDFTLTASPSSVSTASGATSTSTITVTAQGGFTGPVTLTASGAPAGGTATLSPTSVAGSGTSTLTLAAGTAGAGTYTVTVTGTSGALTHSASVSWTVTSASPNAGNLVWTRQIGTSANDYGYGVATDANANLFITGYTSGNLSGLGNGGGTDVYTSKLDANGNTLWRGQLLDPGDSAGRAIALDSNGNVFVAGSTTSTMWTSYKGGPHDGFLARWDANTSGGEAWSQNIGTSGDDVAYGVAVDASGNVYVVGSTNGSFSGTSAGGYDAFLVKFNNAGTELWRTQLGTSADDYAYTVAVDLAGNAFIAGTTGGNLSGTGNLGANDFFIAKYSPSGSRLWVKQGGTAGDDAAYGIAVDSAGNIYIAGATTGGYGFQPQGGYDAFVDKFNSSGVSQWGGRLLGSSADDFAWRVAVDGLGNVHITGGTLGNEAGLPNAGSYDVFLAQYGTNGSRNWVREFGGTGDDQATDVALNSANTIYLVGRTNGAMPGATSSGLIDIFISKFQ